MSSTENEASTLPDADGVDVVLASTNTGMEGSDADTLIKQEENPDEVNVEDFVAEAMALVEGNSSVDAVVDDDNEKKAIISNDDKDEIDNNGDEETKNDDAATAKMKGSSKRKLVTTAMLIRLALKFAYNAKKKQQRHPVVDNLDEMQKDPDVSPGWLRANEAIAAGRPIPDARSFLTTEEKDLLLKLALILKPIVHQTTSKLAYAWGITRNSVNNIINRACDAGDLNPTRKKRSDAGETIANSERKRKAVVTPFFVFKKMKRHERNVRMKQDDSNNTIMGEGVTTPTEQYKPDQLLQMWNNLTPEERNYYEQLANAEQSKLEGIKGTEV